MQPVTAPKPAPVVDLEASYRQLLTRYVDIAGHVDYAGWSASKQDVAALDRYVEALLARQPNSERGLAGWLNLYNGLVLREIVRRWPIASVQDVAATGAPFAGGGRGFFYDLSFDVAGEHMSLLDIETRIIRARFDDPRAHFALNCGARSCPMLPTEPFTAQTLDRRLDQATRAYVNQAAHVNVDHERRVLELSPLFEWYRADFVHLMRRRSVVPAPTLLDFLLVYAEPQLARALVRARDGGYQREVLPYDWRINAIGPPATELGSAKVRVTRLHEPMPPLELMSLDGATWSPAQARGSVVLLDFWATWCRPCLRAFPHYAELQLAHERRGLLVVAVAQDEGAAPVEAFMRANQTAIAIALDPQHRAAEPPLSVSTLPTVLLIDRKGNIRMRYEGYSELDLAQLEEQVEQLLEEGAELAPADAR